MKRLFLLLVSGSLLACSAAPTPVESRSTRAYLSAEAAQTDNTEALSNRSSDCVAADPESCDDISEQLKVARRALARNQAELANLPGAISLQIRFTLRGRPIELEQPYMLSAGEIRLRGLRFWLSQLTLLTDDGLDFEVPESYYLMEVRGSQPLHGGTQAALTLPARRREVIELTRVPSHNYTKLGFNVGVDAAHNDDLSLNPGELSVLQNMASVQWMWFTSYIFTQLDAIQVGDMDNITEDGGMPIDMPILWETGTNQDLRRVELTLPSVAQVGYAQPAQIDLDLDVAALFEGLDQQLAAARSAAPSSPFSAISAADAASRAVLADNWGRAFRPVRVGYGSR